MNNVKEKILLLLFGGLALGFCYTPGKQWKILKVISNEWKRLDRKELREGINYLYKLEFVEKESGFGGITKVSLTKKGKLLALNYQLEKLKTKNQKWDKRWRMVAFDIPQRYKRGRDALRRKLKKIGFCELQKSILITPFDCEKEIGLLVKLFELEKYVRFGILEYIDNEKYFKRYFKLN